MNQSKPLFIKCPQARQGGFTLIELMIAIAIVGLLLAVALPAFMDSIRKSRRSDAFLALNAAVQAQERYRANNASYAASVAVLGLPATSSNGYYGVAVSGESPTGYTVTATATAGKSQTSDGNCVKLQIRAANGNVFYGSSDGVAAFDEAANNRCWGR